MRYFLAVIAFLGLGAAHAQDRSLAELVETCAACHGERGDEATQSSYPLLAGQHADYLAASLRQYRDGGRDDSIMRGQASGLSDAEIKALARYYARQESVLYTPSYGVDN